MVKIWKKACHCPLHRGQPDTLKGKRGRGKKLYLSLDNVIGVLQTKQNLYLFFVTTVQKKIQNQYYWGEQSMSITPNEMKKN